MIDKDFPLSLWSLILENVNNKPSVMYKFLKEDQLLLHDKVLICEKVNPNSLYFDSLATTSLTAYSRFFFSLFRVDSALVTLA